MPRRSPLDWWRQWWRSQSPSRQDRFATLAPLLSVLLFLLAIAVAIIYLRYEELDREQEAVTRDVEYAQQRLRLRPGRWPIRPVQTRRPLTSKPSRRTEHGRCCIHD